jgi:hypothetical protein
MLARQSIGMYKVSKAAFVDNGAAPTAGMRADIDNMVGYFNNLSRSVCSHSLSDAHRDRSRYQ